MGFRGFRRCGGREEGRVEEEVKVAACGLWLVGPPLMTAGRWLAGWPAGWLAGWLAGWHAESADWPIGWLLTLRSARFLLLASVFLVARCSLLAARCFAACFRHLV